MEIKGAKIYKGKKHVETNGGGNYVIDNFMLSKENISEIMSSQHAITLANDIFTKSDVKKKIELSACKTNENVPIKYICKKETFEEYQAKDCEIITAESTMLFENEMFFIAQGKHNTKLLTVFKGNKSFREIENVELVEDAFKESINIAKKHFNAQETEIVSYLTYDGTKRSFYFYTEKVKQADFTEILIFVYDFIRNLRYNKKYYTESFCYIQPVYK